MSIIKATGVEHVAITGGGTIDGQGFNWWRAMEKPGAKDMFRPHMVDMSHVTHVIFSDTYAFLLAPFWAMGGKSTL